MDRGWFSRIGWVEDMERLRVRLYILCLQGTVSFTFIVLAFQVSFEEEGIMSECRKRRCRRSRRRPFFLTHVRV